MEQQMIIPLTVTENHLEPEAPSVNGKATTQQNGTTNTMPPLAETTDQSASLSHVVREAVTALRQEVADGLLYTHSRANSNTSRLLEATSFLYAVIELLAEKGLITIEELDARKNEVAKRVEKRFLEKDMGVNLQEPEQDKYAFSSNVEIDCENRVHLCQAACCRFWFPLSRQDVDEGVVQWDFRYPYIINQDEQGYCRHMDQGSCRCTIYEHRPLPCRAFDCRGDKRIWLDFENKVINPELEDIFSKQEVKLPERAV